MYKLCLCFQALCQVFAVALHYFFLANFSWLMNEAFNLYIVITYSSHAHGQQNDSGSLVRYYILGWSESIEVAFISQKTAPSSLSFLSADDLLSVPI